MQLKSLLIKTYFLLNRIFVKILPVGYMYFWPSKSFLFVKYKTKSELSETLRLYWPDKFDTAYLRAGSDGDGGYIIPNSSIDIMFSAGVDKNIDFEFDITTKFDCPIYMLDRSVDRLPINHTNFNFRKLWLGCSNNEETISINHWIRSYNKHNSKNAALKIDIEGAEYSVIECLEDDLQKNFAWIVCEFHSFENILARDDKITKTIDKILSTHDVFHIHPNNLRKPFRRYGFVVPTDIEFTFLRKDLSTRAMGYAKLPNLKDFDNTNHDPVVLNWVEGNHD